MTGSNVPVNRRTLVALARAVNAIFFLTTSSYCLLTYSSFAYQQFIKPHLVNWLTGFVVWHHLAFWLMLLLTAWTLVPELRRGRWRSVAWSYLAISVAVGTLLLVRPILPQVENNGRGLALALVALLPPIWLAVFDHRHALALTPSSEGRVFKSALIAAVLVWGCQVAVIPWRWNQTGDITLRTGDFAFGVVTSLAGHVLVFAILAAAVSVLIRASRKAGSGAGEYWLIVLTSAAGVMLVTNRIVFAGIAFSGAAAWTLSMLFGVLVAAVWSGAVHILRADRADHAESAIDSWLSPLPFHRTPIAAGVLASLVVVEAAGISYLMTFDWDFLLQKLFILIVWFIAFGYTWFVVRSTNGPLSLRRLAAYILASLACFAGSVGAGRLIANVDDAFVPEFVLEGYVAVDPSYRLVHDGLAFPSAEQSRFYSHLRANSLIQHVSVDPIQIDFDALPAPSPEEKPHIFLFVIDSLRRDYVSPYNPKVAFTPAIGKFAQDAVVFDRAFTRYGGTGLAVPAIWAGGMLLHKQYVTPFDPMNTLLRLVETDGYRRLMSMDSIVVQLMSPPPPADEVDRGVPVVEYRFCRTLEDMTSKLPGAAGDPRPIFAYTLPQDIHISHVRSEPVPAGKSYDGFFAPVAAQIERMDACFGEFIHFLKRSKLYDNSVIIVTSDHGDSLGEMLRWGHSYTMFPEVSRIPLIVRVPDRFRERFVVDARAVSLSTDITPTLYALLGHHPADLGPLYGRPLFVPRDRQPSRRPEPLLIASSYGGVYAVLHDNGSRIYIADGVNGRDYAYDLTGELPVRIGVTPASREADQQFIRAQVDDIARAYHFVAER